ncbi:MAG: MerR family transcriptional regulator [Eubacterium sp.]
MLMSKYTTGEMAKLCGVTVRTVQYYDSRGILVPTELSEGGRRLYNDDDLKKLRIICYLKNLGLSLNNIADILTAENSQNVISTILLQQMAEIKSSIEKQKESLVLIDGLLNELESSKSFSVESINDIVAVMESKKSLRNLHIKMIFAGIAADAIEISAIVLWIVKGLWLPFAAGMVLVIILCTWIFNVYCKQVAYICPECHTIFKASKREILFSKHTPKTRMLTCTNCGHKGYCVETES